MEQEIKDKLEALSEEYATLRVKKLAVEREEERIRFAIQDLTPPEGYAATFCKVGWMSRKSWEYSDELIKKEKQYKEEIDKEKEAQQKDGAKFKESKTLRVEFY